MRPLYLIGLDGVGTYPLRRWIQQGLLPNLHETLRLRPGRRICILDNKNFMRTENSWQTFVQGIPPNCAKEWGHCIYTPDDYSYHEHCAYSFREAPPFFRTTSRTTVVFDVPLMQVDTANDAPLNRIEIYGWGAESNQFGSSSSPVNLLSKLTAAHGHHPIFSKGRLVASGSDIPEEGYGDHGIKQYRLPSLYQPQALEQLCEGLIDGASRRTAIINELLSEHQPELAVCVYSEAHTAGHMFWHLSQPHPLGNKRADDALLAVLQAIDTGLGHLINNFTESDVLLFSPQGMQANFIEMFTSTFLPEMLYRRSQRGWILGGNLEACLQLDPSRYKHWKDAVVELLNPSLSHLLDTPARLADRADPLDWSPARWYQPLWPKLEAFALPSFSEGLVRLNVRGREGGPDGLEWTTYDEVCQQITDDLLQWRDVRTGRRIVHEVVRTRSSPSDQEGPLALMPADLVVKWREPVITNHIGHPILGEIGPLPYFRTGAHSSQGMMIDLTPNGSFLPASGSKLPLTDFVRAIRRHIAT